MSSSGSVAGSFTHAAVSAAPLLWFLEAGLHTVDPAERSQWELLWPVHSLNTKQSPAMVGCELNSVCTVCGLCPSPLSPWRFLATSLKGEEELRWQRAGFSHECVWDDLCRLLQRDEAIVLGIGYVRASLGHSGKAGWSWHQASRKGRLVIAPHLIVMQWEAGVGLLG